MGILMRGLLAAIALGAVSCSPEAPAQVVKICTSDSGQSQFIIDLDLSVGTGQLRYQFFGQDILYRVDDMHVDDEKIVGTGLFYRSATGEVRGTPIEFEYYFQKNSFVDGATSYECDQLQDRSLTELPIV